MSKITSPHLQNFAEQGYMVVEDFFTEQDLNLLRDKCDAGIDDMHQRMDAAGTDVLHISHRNSRYFINDQVSRSAQLRNLAFSDKMADLCTKVLGEDVYLFLDQYVVKSAETGMSFAWHQDAGYITHTKVRPYLTCWIPLDDVTVANGTVFVLPYSEAGSKEVIEHVKDPHTNDMVGYQGDNPGIPLIVKAGTLVAFSSHLLHRSSPNETDKMRRVYLLQYTSEPIFKADGSQLNKAIPFIKKGELKAEFAQS